jgi:L-alanine-DL-glutamate epimerase-like enolase superfamily enzyme
MTMTVSSSVSYNKPTDGVRNAADSGDRIASVALSLVVLPLAEPISDAKVLTGRQKPLTEIAFVFAEIRTRDGHEGIGFGYAKRAGGPGMYAHAKELAPNLIGEDPNDIAKLFTKLLWAGASMGRSGMTTQAIAPFDIALWDLKAKRAGLPLGKLLGAHRDSVQCYNTSGGYLSTPIEQVLKNVEVSRDNGIGGIKIKVGQPDVAADLARVKAVRGVLGDQFPFMVDANQQWDRTTAQRVGRRLEEHDLVWIEEPLDAYDFEGHAALAASLDTPIATGEMLTSFGEHAELINAGIDLCSPMPRHRPGAGTRRHAWVGYGRHWEQPPHRRACDLSVAAYRARPHGHASVFGAGFGDRGAVWRSRGIIVAQPDRRRHPDQWRPNPR